LPAGAIATSGNTGGGDSGRSGGTGAGGAGALLIGAILACAAVGLAVGVVVGAPTPLALAGGFAGVGVGFWLVYDRFKDL
jgi:hypothetical protein